MPCAVHTDEEMAHCLLRNELTRGETCRCTCEAVARGEYGVSVDLPGAALMPGDLPCQELPHDHSKTVHVTAEGVAAARQNLRGQPAGVAGCHAAQNGRLLHDS